MKINKIAYKLELELPEIIKKIVLKYGISPYLDNPNFLEERNNMWHQFGLLTHTKMVRRVFLSELNPLLKKWGLYENIEKILSERVDSVPKKSLLEISFPLHDLGKIICFYNKKENRNHALLSQKLLSEKILKEKLTSFGLSKEHVDYIGKCIQTHSLLSQEIREKIQENDYFNLSSIPKTELDYICEDLANKNQEIKVETGVFFLCDSLAKTDVRVSKDYKGEVSEHYIEQVLKERGLPDYLKEGVIQLPENIKLAETYLKNIFKSL